MDTALELLTAIYSVYRTISDGQETFGLMYEQLSDLLTQLRSMEEKDTLVQSELLEKYVDLSVRFLEYLESYKRRHFVSKLLRQKGMLEQVQAFKSELETLFRLYHLAMGSHIVETEREHSEQLHELTRGMRILLEGSGDAPCGRRRRSNKWTTDRAAERAGEPGEAVLVSPTSMAVIDSVEDERVEAAQAAFDWELLVSFVRSGSDTQKQQAAAALFELSVNGEHLAEIVAAGAIPPLLDLLKIGNEDAQVSAAKALRCLAVLDANEGVIVASGGFATLLQLMKTSSSRVKDAASGAFCNLVFLSDHKPLAMAAGAVPVLVNLVRSGESDAQKTHAANSLRELALDATARVEIADEGGIAALANLIHTGTSTQCDAAVEALWNLSLREENKAQIAAVGGIEALVKQLTHGDTDEQKQRAASALTVLAQGDANDSHIAAAGGIEALLELLKKGTTQGQRNSAAWALSAITSVHSNKVRVATAGGIPILLDAVKKGGSDIQREKAAHALADVAQVPENAQAIVDAGGLDVLLLLLCNGTDSQKQRAAGVVWSLSQNADLKTEVGESGVLEVLVDLIQNGSESLRKTAAAALKSLVGSHASNRSRFVALGGVELLITTMRSTTESAKTDAVRALYNMAVDDDVKIKIGVLGGIHLLVELLQSGENVLQKEGAAGALKLLALSDANDRRFLAAAGVKALVDALSTDAETVRTQVVTALSYWSAKPEVLVTLGSMRTIRALLDVLKRGTAEQREKALETIKNISLVETNHVKLAGAGVVEDLVAVLETGSDSMRESATATLWNLATQTDIKPKIAHAGAVEPLIRFLGTGTPAIQDRAAGALRALGKQRDIATQITYMGGVQAFVKLLRSNSTVELQINACGAIGNLAVVPENAPEIADAGATLILIDAIKSNSAALRAVALRALCQLSKHEIIVTTDIVSAGGITALVALASAREDESLVALATLRNLARHSDLKESITTNGTIDLLVELLESSSAKHKEEAAGVLWNLSANNTRKSELTTPRVIEVLLVTLNQEAGEVAVTNVLGALGNLIADASVARQVAENHGASTFVSLLRDDERFQDKAKVTSVIRNLAFHGEARALVKAGVIVPLTKCLVHEPHSGCRNAAAALWSLGLVDDETKLEIAQADGLSKLCNVLKTGSEQERVEAQGAVEVLLSNGIVAEGYAQAAGLIDLCVEELRSTAAGPGDNTTNRRALGLLRRMAAHSKLAAILAAAGVISPVLTLLHNGSEDERQDGIELLTALSRNAACRSIILAAGGMEYLELLTNAGSAKQRAQAQNAVSLLRALSH